MLTLMPRSGNLHGLLHAYSITFNSNHLLTFYASKVPAGFPSPADDYIEEKIDLNELATKHSAAAFIVRVKGSSMIEAGIQEGDFLVVDRSIDPIDGKIIVVSIDGNVTVKKLSIKNGKASLVAANSKFKPIALNEHANIEIFGVVVSVMHFF